MATYQDVRDFVDKVYGLFRENKLETAVALMLDNSDLPMDKLPQIDFVLWMYNRTCLLARAGHTDLALAQFEEAIERGFWYSPNQLIGDEDLEPLADNPRFIELRDISIARYEQKRNERQSYLDVYPPANSDGEVPLFMALHGNISSASLNYENWQSVPDYGHLLAMPNSKQLFIEGAYLWGDFDEVQLDLKAHYDTLMAQYPLDPAQTILAGYITGGNLAVWATLNKIFPVKGFIVVGLYVRNLDEYIQKMDALRGTNVRGYMLIGEEDTGSFENTIKFVDEIRQRGIECELDIRKGLGHDAVPDDFAETLKRAIDFVSR